MAEEKAADDAAKVKATESQKVAITEQLGARPLARMQEALDEKAAAEGSSTPATTEGKEEGSTTPPHAPADGSVEAGSSEAAASAEASTSAQPSASTASGDRRGEAGGQAAGAAATAEPATALQAPLPTSAVPSSMGTVPSPPPPQRQYAVLRDDDRELVRVQRVRFDASGPLRSWRMLLLKFQRKIASYRVTPRRVARFRSAFQRKVAAS